MQNTTSLTEQPITSLTKEPEAEGCHHAPQVVLLGDVGGTNIRLQLIQLSHSHDKPLKIFKEDHLKVEKYPQFHLAIEDFLKGCVHPKVAVVALAGPVKNNTVRMSNVEQWGDLNGEELGKLLNIHTFLLLNDFEAAAYGAAELKDEDLININGKPVHPGKVKSVVGPGTGLGTAMVYPLKFKDHYRGQVLPGEGGHVYFGPSNDLEAEFYSFLKQQKKDSGLIVLERVFCGPSIPYMYKFFAKKHPERPEAKQNPNPTSEQIIQKGLKEPGTLYRMSLDLFVSIYSSFIGDNMLRTLCYGGIYLVGGLSLSVAEYLKDPATHFMETYYKQRPYLSKIFEQMPIVVCKETDIGLKGTFVCARRIIFDMSNK